MTRPARASGRATAPTVTPPGYGLSFVDRDPAAVHRSLAGGLTDSRPLPFLAEIQRSFGGFDVRRVGATVGGRMQDVGRDLGVRACARGEAVGFCQPPDLHSAAHEAAHVIQQRGGVSVPGGVGRPGDAHEQLADRVADLVVRGESAEPLLHRHGSRARRPGAAPAPVVQFEVSEEFKQATPTVTLTGASTLGDVLTKTGADDRSVEDDLGNLIYDQLDRFAPAILAVSTWMLAFLRAYLDRYADAEVEKKEPTSPALAEFAATLAEATRAGDPRRLLDLHYKFANDLYTETRKDRRQASDRATGSVKPWDPKAIRKRVPAFANRSRTPTYQPFTGRGIDYWQVDSATYWEPPPENSYKPGEEPPPSTAVHKPNVFGERAAIYGMPITAGVSGTASDYVAIAHNAGLGPAEQWAYGVATAGRMIKFRHHSFDEIFTVLAASGVAPYQRGAYLLPFAVDFDLARALRTSPAFRAWRRQYAARIGPESFSPDAVKLVVPRE